MSLPEEEELEEPPMWLDAGERTDTICFAACPMWYVGCRFTTGWYDDSDDDLENAKALYREHWRDEH